METLRVVMKLEKETKNTRRYIASTNGTGMPPGIDALYIDKWALGDKPPATIVVEVVDGVSS